MPNFPGSSGANPGVYTDVITQSRGVSLPGGTRVAAIIGEGSSQETLVAQAQGNGKDGLNSSYSGVSGSDGRHFRLSTYPIVSNRTRLFKNGVPLVGLESLIDSNSFNNKYDYRIDISSGKIELQKAHLVDQGGSYFTTLSTNVGLGTLNTLTLQNVNAPPETWTIRCVGVQRNVSNQPIAGTAKFLAFGSKSGAKLDANGNPVVWMANDTVVSNGILSFSIKETEVMSVVTSPFREGDAFVIKVDSGVLNRNDSLTITYIPVANINDPLLVAGMDAVVRRHGLASVDNNLSLGCQLLFSNSAPAVVTLQAAPPMPRRQSFELTDSVDATSDNDDDFIFPLPLGTVPNFDSDIHFFVTNPTTKEETQILPNKLDFYTLGTSGYPTVNQFITDTTPAPGGYSYFYTVIQSFAALASGFDGYIGRDLAFTNKGVFSSVSTSFDSSYVGKTLKIIDATNVANINEYTVTSVSNGKLYVTGDPFPEFVNETSTSFQVIEPTTGLAIVGYEGTDGTLIKLVSTSTATLSSASVDFSTLSGLLGKKLKINGSDDNNGLYDITAYDSGTDTITIQKAVVNESDMRFEVLDASDESDFVVINKNVVPSGYGLRVTIVDTKDASFYDAGWVNALESLEKVDCDIVVPLPKQTISVILQNTLNHCKAMSNILVRKERVMFTGAIKGLTPNNLIGTEDAAVEDIGILEGIQGETITDVLAGNVEDLANYSVYDAFGNTFRCVYFYPDEIVVQAGTDNVIIDGLYVAAAAAGYVSADVKIQNPLTNKVISGFTILRDKQLTPTVLNLLSNAGVCVLQPVSGGGRVIWGRTTTNSGFPEEQEISVVFIRDRIAKLLRAGFQGYIGEALDKDLLSSLTARAFLLANSFVSQKLITDYKDLVVVIDPVDPTQVNVSIRVQPVYGLNYIYVKVGVGQLN